MSNILFLFEGEVTENRYFNVIEKCFKNKIKSKINFYCYKTNIHVLYDELKKDDSLDIIELVKEKAKKANDNENYKMLDENKFGEIYLIFDLEIQDQRYTNKKIDEMLSLFNNETEHGKLYINYPMVESFKHFSHLPDLNYNNYKVEIQNCKTYKHDVAKISCINDYKKIDAKKYFIIVKQNLDKINLLINNSNECDYNTYIDSLGQSRIFEIQKQEIKNNNSIYVVNTLCLWPLDYFNSSIFNQINNIIINDK